ncbi:MAG: c-type cytochrome [Prolixibacteraceae bacterium]|nr:c-type cytochrome [Prolixibacteraceae bacterium]
MTDKSMQTKGDGHKQEKYFSDHDYDGIKELNNPSPYWVLLLFLGTIGFSLFYAVHYFGYPDNGRDQYSEYNKQMAMAGKKSDQNPATQAGAFVMDQAQMDAGAKLFTEKGCIACHGAKGEGNAIGPNMTDKFWINGCKPVDLIKVVTEGVPAKGMTPFKSMMTEAQIKSVVAYILGALVGSNPPNAKAQQGVECK